MIQHLTLIQLLIDFGLVVLILMVQFTIYPSFLYFERDDLHRWHHKYTGQIALVVAPLMIIQLILALFFMFENMYYATVVTAILTIAAWVSTFVHFVPIHGRITDNTHGEEDLVTLVQRNWLRVVIWCLLFGWDLYFYSIKFIT